LAIKIMLSLMYSYCIRLSQGTVYEMLSIAMILSW
jgi:hypothetical protein